MAKVAGHKILTTQDVIDLGQALLKTSNLYPLRFVTERDFFPLVVTYLNGRVPALETEVSTDHGRIDFQLKGNNPTWLELAVQSRALTDKNCPNIEFPGTDLGTLYASQNRNELQKLMTEPKGKTRFLLLLDLNGGYNFPKLKSDYRAEALDIAGRKSVRVVYVSPNGPEHFKAG